MINKVSATYTIYVILLKSTIHGPLINSYFIQVKTVRIYLLINLASCELWSIKEMEQLKVIKQYKALLANAIFY